MTLTTWILILTILHPPSTMTVRGPAVALTSIPGFVTEDACTAAAKKWIGSVRGLSGDANIIAVCVKS